MNKYLLLLKRFKDKAFLLKCVKYLCIVACIYFLLNIFFFDTYSLSEYKRSQARLKKLEQQNEQLTQTNLQLQSEIHRLKNDPFFIETIARRDYRMVKKGETVYIFSNTQKQLNTPLAGVKPLSHVVFGQFLHIFA